MYDYYFGGRFSMGKYFFINIYTAAFSIKGRVQLKKKIFLLK